MQDTFFYSSTVTSVGTGTSVDNLSAIQPATTYLKPNHFKFQIGKLPNITCTCQSAHLPMMSIGEATQETPFVDIPHPGDKVKFSDFSIRFLMNQDMSNYKELYDWLNSIGVSSSRTQYNSFAGKASVFAQDDYNNTLSDATLIVVDGSNNPVVRINFQDLFPIALEGLDFDITSPGMEYFVGVATFRYKIFTIEKITV